MTPSIATYVYCKYILCHLCDLCLFAYFDFILCQKLTVKDRENRREDKINHTLRTVTNPMVETDHTVRTVTNPMVETDHTVRTVINPMVETETTP